MGRFSFRNGCCGLQGVPVRRAQTGEGAGEHACVFSGPALGTPDREFDIPPAPFDGDLTHRAGDLTYRTGLFTYRFRSRTFQHQRQKKTDSVSSAACRSSNISIFFPRFSPYALTRACMHAHTHARHIFAAMRRSRLMPISRKPLILLRILLIIIKIFI